MIGELQRYFCISVIDQYYWSPYLWWRADKSRRSWEARCHPETFAFQAKRLHVNWFHNREGTVKTDRRIDTADDLSGRYLKVIINLYIHLFAL